MKISQAAYRITLITTSCAYLAITVELYFRIFSGLSLNYALLFTAAHALPGAVAMAHGFLCVDEEDICPGSFRAYVLCVAIAVFLHLALVFGGARTWGGWMLNVWMFLLFSVWNMGLRNLSIFMRGNEQQEG